MISNPTAQQLALASAQTVLVRSLAGQLMKLMNQMNAANQQWIGEVSSIVNAGTMGQTITDSSNLADVSPLTDTDVTNIMSYYQGILTSYYDSPHQQELVKACGASNAF